jgi:DNA-binding NarL/FixJ family response regulator
MRVLIVDDHPVVLAGMSVLIDEIEGFEVVGQANDGATAVRLATELKPDIALLDIQMPGMNGYECLVLFDKVSPETRTLVMSMHSEEEHVFKAVELGAKGYVLKGSDPAELELALKTVSMGSLWFSSGVSSHFIKREKPVAEIYPPPQADLSPRQLEILKRIAQGSSTKQIAFELSISIKTVESHRSAILERLNLTDVASLVRYAVRSGIVAA